MPTPDAVRQVSKQVWRVLKSFVDRQPLQRLVDHRLRIQANEQAVDNWAEMHRPSSEMTRVPLSIFAWLGMTPPKRMTSGGRQLYQALHNGLRSDLYSLSSERLERNSRIWALSALKLERMERRASGLDADMWALRWALPPLAEEAQEMQNLREAWRSDGRPPLDDQMSASQRSASSGPAPGRASQTLGRE